MTQTLVGTPDPDRPPGIYVNQLTNATISGNVIFVSSFQNDAITFTSCSNLTVSNNIILRSVED